MAVTLELMNSAQRPQLNWDNDDVVPKTLPDGSPIPANFWGMNLDTGIVYFWKPSINDWAELGGQG